MRLFLVTKKQEEHTLLQGKDVFTMGLLRNVVYYKILRHVHKKVIDTTNLSPRKLREEIMQAFSTGKEGVFTIQVMSFGFKYGLPIDADVVMDVRFLPNPHYIPELRPLTGLDDPVYDYVMSQPEAKTFLS